jgi:stage V sporulation protein SpoVS
MHFVDFTILVGAHDFDHGVDSLHVARTYFLPSGTRRVSTEPFHDFQIPNNARQCGETNARGIFRAFNAH